MPFSLLIQGTLTTSALRERIQGPALQKMFLQLMHEVEPAVAERLHADQRYRPYTLSPLGLGKYPHRIHGFSRPQKPTLPAGTPCYLRMTLLDDTLFATFNRYFEKQPGSILPLGNTHFTIAGIFTSSKSDESWTHYLSHAELLNTSSQTNRRIHLWFLSPTSFRRGDLDFALPDPRLVFQSYRKRFGEFHDFAFLSDFNEQVDAHVGIAKLEHLHTSLIATKRIKHIGFTGRVSYEISKKAPPELMYQMNLLARYAFFCGTGKKTTVGMGQTVCTNGSR